jgi:cytochrome c peroxidase
VAVSHADGALRVLDVTTGALVRTAALAGSLGRVALDGARELLAVSVLAPQPALLLVDTRDLTVRARAELDQPADWLAFGSAADTLVISTRADASLRALQREGTWMRELTRLLLGRPAVTLARLRDGAELALAVTDYRPDGTPQRGNHFVQDQILRVATAPLRVLSSWPTARRSERQLSPGSVDRGLSPMGIAEVREGTLLTFAGSEEVWRVPDDGAAPVVRDVGEQGGYAPHSAVELADGTLVVSSPSAGVLLLIAPGKSELVLRLAPDDAYLAAHDREALARRLGERAFYEATQSGIACQSCHLHADSDQRAHNLGTHGLLPTLSVRGLAGTAPYLRDGSFARIRELDHVSRTLYRGYRRKAPGRAETLEAYVEALPRVAAHARTELGRAAMRAGLRVFVAAGCVACHSLPAFTGLGQHVARSLFPGHPGHAPDDVLDTPSLLSIASTPPYLSDGRAHSLSEVIGLHNRADRHGHTRDLSVAQRAALLTFLESL